MLENKILKKILSEEFVSKSEIRELIKQYKESKDEKEKEKLSELIFNNNVRYIRKISCKFNKLYSDPEDCFQNGVLGFYSALEKFELDKKTAFTTYLFFWVCKFIYEGSQIYSVGVPRNIQHMNYVYSKYKNICDQQTQEHNKKFLNRKIFSDKTFNDKYINNINGPISINVVSLDGTEKFNNKSENKQKLINIIRDNKNSPEFIVIQNLQKERLIKVIEKKLNDQEKKVIMLRYFSDTENLLTLKEIVEKLGTTSERIRQIEENALFKLKRVLSVMRREGKI